MTTTIAPTTTPPPSTFAEPPADEPLRRFQLVRWHDGTGVSGTGIIADGVAWADGRAITRWTGGTSGVRQVSVWDSTDDILHIHGHGGRTEIVWIDAATQGTR